ncbi:MAG: hypothetical protein EOR52_18820 [Mesorhizobium sp.]|uniref:hypothetical protein n=1 Tax=Mesorhizobium sp. TaxID=1871066 RepID=UPI000FE85915|nr:hypothetical protein [Mesorhizobium sp.]RWK87177.1 MAG: hypothetical protein EOR52_18820 [Mesorhizobium sp.]
MGGINEGLSSDRLLVDWLLDDAVVAAKSEGRLVAEEPKDSLRIRLPDDVQTLMRCHREEVVEARLAYRISLRDAFAGGFQLTGFDCGELTYVSRRMERPDRD